jgi:ABC-type dipeptide/oligopeptide/nickel transport system permease subunit
MKNGSVMSLKKAQFIILSCLAVVLVILAVLGPALAPTDPVKTDLSASLSPPDSVHLLGTDKLGRDMLSRILYGASTSFSLTFGMVLLVAFIGTIVGVVSGYAGGVIDTVIMRFTDILLAFPATVFAIAVVGMLGPGVLNTILALATVSWTKYARMTRSLTAAIRGENYIIQARFSGAREYKIILKYILPNVISQIVIMMTLDIGGMMMTLASLSFLGLASQPPTPEWGYMLYESRQFMQTAPWLMLYPGLALLITVIVFNLLGDSLRDALDPKERN